MLRLVGRHVAKTRNNAHVPGGHGFITVLLNPYQEKYHCSPNHGGTVTCPSALQTCQDWKTPAGQTQFSFCPRQISEAKRMQLLKEFCSPLSKCSRWKTYNQLIQIVVETSFICKQGRSTFTLIYSEYRAVALRWCETHRELSSCNVGLYFTADSDWNWWGAKKASPFSSCPTFASPVWVLFTFTSS